MSFLHVLLINKTEWEEFSLFLGRALPGAVRFIFIFNGL